MTFIGWSMLFENLKVLLLRLWRTCQRGDFFGDHECNRNADDKTSNHRTENRLHVGHFIDKNHHHQNSDNDSRGDGKNGTK